MQPGDVRTDTGRLLRRFLEYARAPETAIEADISDPSGGDAESPFEESVGRALVERGYNLNYQVGVSGYRIDIGIVDDETNEYVLGIQCDGATYHSSAAARDRDWLRQSVLEGLGWRVHRIWSTSWVRNRADELVRLEEAIRQAQIRARSPSPAVPETIEDEDASLETALLEPEPVQQMGLVLGNSNEALRELFDSYQIADLSDVAVGSELVNETRSRLVTLARRVVETESPVHIDSIVDRVRTRYGHGRAGRLIRERVVDAVFEVVKLPEFAWVGEPPADRRPPEPAQQTIHRRHRSVRRAPHRCRRTT